MLKRVLARGILLLSLCLFGTSLPVNAQDSGNDQCADIRYLMAQNAVPYLTPGVTEIGGGVLTATNAAEMPAHKMADFWSFAITEATTLELNFLDVPNNTLEFAVFQGMVSVENALGEVYRPILPDTPYTLTLNPTPNSTAYTLIVQRRRLADPTEFTYTFTANFDNGAGPTTIESERQLTNISSSATPVTVVFEEGLDYILYPDDTAVVLSHPRAVEQAGTYGGTMTQAIFQQSPFQSFSVGSWASEIAFLGGNVAVTGPTRTFYMEGFDYKVDYGTRPVDINLNLIEDSTGTEIEIDWQAIAGIWILDSCAGVKLTTGQRFTAALGNRIMRFGGTAGNFEVELTAPNAAGELTPYRLQLDLANIAPDGEEVALLDGVFRALALPGDRRLRLEATNLVITSDLAQETEAPVPLEITVNETKSIAIDWQNIEALALVSGPENIPIFEIQFMDEVRKARPTVRPAADFITFSAREDIVHIRYELESGEPGPERLLLPAEEGYVELLTPGGTPDFSPEALPDQPGYMPRTLNNLGGECYPFNTLALETDCPTSGHPNPANGNLWYAVTDHIAPGGWLDLALTRSYNSYDYTKDGPFGFGWTTDYLIDFPVRFDESTNARVVDLDTLNYHAALDLTWAPRGLVTFTTASGSRHAFARDEDTTTPEIWRALSMPEWTLRRADIRSAWTLTQEDSGLVYEFDRAGRLHGYGYPAYERWITIDYPWETAIYEPGNAIITDAAEWRQLELYFDSDYHIERSILRDLTGQKAGSKTCEQADNCFEITYEYKDGRLVGVTYPDEQSAAYEYDGANRLIWHSDPRAPVTPTMAYTYINARAHIASIYLLAPGERAPGDRLAWRQLRLGELGTDANNRPIYRVTMDREYGSETTVYRLVTVGSLPETDPWRGGRDNFRSVQISSPLDELGTTQFEWSNAGLLTNIGAQKTADGFVLRNNIALTYTPDGDLKSIVPVGGYGAFIDITREENTTTLAFDDLSDMTLVYDQTGHLTGVEDRAGALYRYEWSENELIYTRENDGKVWQYSLTALGLPGTVTQRQATDEPETAWYTVDYRWDGLGRLTGITDPVLGEYKFSYALLPCVDDCDYTEARMEITVTDPVGAITRSYIDGRGRLIQTCLANNPDCTEFLRKTTYTYDDLDRLTGQTRWLSTEDGEANALTDTYTYTPIETLAAIPGVTDTDITIKGYQITHTDPLGQTRTFIYDALGRVRQTSDGPHQNTRYEYQANNGGDYFWQRPNVNLRIVQYDLLYDRLTATTYYYFDLRWQLRRVLRVSGDGAEASWEFEHAATSTTNLLGMNFIDTLNMVWAEYAGGSPQAVQRADNFGTDPASLSLEYDFLKRPIAVTTTGEAFAYCNLSQSSYRVVYSHPQAPPDFGCNYQDDDIANVAEVRYYDAHDRLTQIHDEAGTRTFEYYANPAQNRWEVIVETAPLPGHGTPQRWEMHYNTTGDLTYWRDDTGTEHHYQYDTLGQLRRVTVPGEPEASFTFTYNNAGLLTSVMDGLRRGTIYTYDRSQLMTAQDRSTGAVTTYTYDLNGRLKSITSPQGSTTSYDYADPHDPDRITHIHMPGGTHEYSWDDEIGTLTYTNPRGHITRYTFDITGRLWQIDDTAGDQPRTYTLNYNDVGHLVEWARDTADGSQVFQLTYDPATYAVAISEESMGDAWGWSFRATPSGLIKSVTNPAGQNLRFEYDPWNHLSAAAAGALNWTLAREDGTLHFEAQDETALLSFDVLYRLREDNNRSYRYEQESGTSNTVLQIIEDASTRTYTFSPGTSLPDSIQMETPPRVVLEAPGHRVVYTYDREGRLVEIARAACIEPATSCFDVTDASVWRSSTRISHDAQGHPVQIADDAHGIETFAYDAAGNLASYRNFRDEVFHYFYDGANRLTQLTGPTGIKLLLDYDALDRLTGLCRTRAEAPDDYMRCLADGGELATYGYDALGRLVSQTYPNLADETERASLTYQYAAEGGGRMTAWSAADGIPATLTYTEDGLSMLRSLNVVTDSYTLAYEYTATPGDLFRLAAADGAQSGSLQFDYTAGRVTELDAAGHTLRYGYEPDNWWQEIESGDTSMRFSLDERGLLNTVHTPEQTYLAGIELGLSRSEQTALVLGLVQDGELMLELTLDADGSLRHSDYLAPDQSLTVSYDQPGPQTVRRILEGELRLFALDVEGYDVTVGYDLAGQPRIMQVNDALTGALLYTATYTYDPVGLRTGEIHTYADGSQRHIIYSYTNNQLTGHEVRHVAPNTEKIEQTFTYTYDTAGNIQSISFVPADTDGESVVCTTYTYDSANRLIEVQLGETTRRYAYDVYNRLVNIDGERRYVYHGLSDIPLLSVEGTNGALYYAQMANGPMLFAGTESSITWALHDGDTFTSDPQSALLWLLDPLGRPLSLQPPGAPDDPCDELRPDGLPARLQPVFEGMIWDAQTGLYFKDGRAYAPVTGRFLQRATPGEVYDYTTPPVQERPPVYMAGLITLRAALAAAHPTEALSAQAIAAQHRPNPLGVETTPFLALLNQSYGLLRSELIDSLIFPDWVKSAYNLPDAHIDRATGALNLPLATAPGNGEGTPSIAALSILDRDTGLWTPTLPESYLAGLMVHAALPMHDLTTYKPMAWRPARAGLADTLHVARPALDIADTPAAVWGWLPHTLTTPERAAGTLELVQRIAELPSQTGADWLQTILTRALPKPPSLPPPNIETWRKIWFEQGLDAALELDTRWHILQPRAPVYRLGINPDWLYP